jgi:undecaprenyl-diphosphatase
MAVVAFATFMSDIAPKIAGVGLLVAGVAGGRAVRQAVLRCVLAMVLSWLAVAALRRGFPMPRPAALHMGWQWLEHGTRSGFPSQHAAGAMAFWAGLAMSPVLISRPVLVTIGLVLALAIAWSRVYLGVHFPRDVVVGGAIGWVAGAGVMVLENRLGQFLRRRRVRAERLRRRSLPVAPT